MIDIDGARALMADSLGFHIIFALLGVGLPLVILLIEQLGLRRKDPLILEHAKRLSQATVILVIAGVASGTIISIQMSLMWGKLIEFGGPILGLAFGWEGYAFMLEAVFLAFYVSTWGKVKGWRHWLLGVPVAIGSFGSAFAITLGNAWMQNPSGFEVVNGVVQTDNVLGALFTKTAFYMVSHSIAGYYLATVLCVLGIYAFYMLRHKPKNQDRMAVQNIMFRLGATAIVLVAVTATLGHFQTQYLATSQPRKFAAIETVEQTRRQAPYIIGGEWTSEGKVEGGIKIPNGLSILAGNSPRTEVKGLNDYPKTDWPMLFVNILFESKLFIVAIISIIPIIFVGLHSPKLRKSARDWRYKKAMLIALLPLGLLAIIVVELGWMVAEFGRQPFVVNGYLRTDEAFSATSGIGNWGYVFPILFILLFVTTATALWLLFKRKGKIKPTKGLL
ncbi:cytochrome ubiquinol oxidase subunit I [Candidatus Saccharibacteria bacterium]|nr:cytochrome ubiquinol oxidase subunit I [Candidatus Saccharibacteria bacterium]MBH1972834.1 cytochrome ubiquinol oxidase subunit I [Candidatus Saccharibacteria bacterium]MBH1991035.1 cytochrome ubiquinol oxidase subunit I [Candidatus Saccharibacteria bacterium]